MVKPIDKSVGVLTIKCDACGHPWQGGFQFDIASTSIMSMDGMKAQLQLIPKCCACGSIALKFGKVRVVIVSGKEG
jgi:hypothetical protein